MRIKSSAALVNPQSAFYNPQSFGPLPRAALACFATFETFRPSDRLYTRKRQASSLRLNIRTS
jgi:hypothetical protein